MPTKKKPAKKTKAKVKKKPTTKVKAPAIAKPNPIEQMTSLAAQALTLLKETGGNVFMIVPTKDDDARALFFVTDSPDLAEKVRALVKKDEEEQDAQLKSDEMRNDPDVIHNCLSLVMEAAPSVDEIQKWTDEERELAGDWAAAVHLDASDNEGITVPARPSFLDKYLTDYEKGIEGAASQAEVDDDGNPVEDIMQLMKKPEDDSAEDDPPGPPAVAPEASEAES